MKLELSDTVDKPRLKDEWTKRAIDVPTLLTQYHEMVEFVQPIALAQPVSRDPDDDIVIATALAARADMIVTGDMDLLTLGSHNGIQIMNAHDTVATLDG